MSKKTSKPSDASVKGVAPVNPVEGDTGAPSSPRGKGGPIEGARSVISGVGGGILNALKNGVHGIKNGGRRIGSMCGSGFESAGHALHISKAAAGTLIIGSILLGSGAAVFGFYGHQQNQLILRQEDDEDDCVEDIEKMKVSSSVGDVNGLKKEYALKAWSVGKALGMTDEMCAGMLGNMEGESSMDPTTIETIMDEPFNIEGPRKSAAASDLCAFTTSVMRESYIRSGCGINAYTSRCGATMAYASNTGADFNIGSQWYEGVDGHFFPGIGLFGFTGPEGNALVAYAESAPNLEWWDFDLQMAFIFDLTGGYGRAEWVDRWIRGQGEDAKQPSSPGEAALQWNKYFEGNSSDVSDGAKSTAAETWYGEFAGQMGDQAYANSIIELANSIQGGGTSKAVAKAEKECEEAESQYDNSDLARAAVAYAYETVDMGRGNNGTQLYQAVHDAVFPGDGYYMSCDRGVTTAVRWAGADDDIDPGYTDSLDVYFQGTPTKWELVGKFDDMSIEDLQPGDILNTTSGRRTSYSCGHIVMYVGNEIVKEKFPNSDACIVSASLDDRSPGCETYSESSYKGDGYYVYRNVKTEDNPQYKDCVKGQNLSGTN